MADRLLDALAHIDTAMNALLDAVMRPSECCFVHGALAHLSKGRGRRPRFVDRSDWWQFPREVRRKMLVPCEARHAR